MIRCCNILRIARRVGPGREEWNQSRSCLFLALPARRWQEDTHRKFHDHGNLIGSFHNLTRIRRAHPRCFLCCSLCGWVSLEARLRRSHKTVNDSDCFISWSWRPEKVYIWQGW